MKIPVNGFPAGTFSVHMATRWLLLLCCACFVAPHPALARDGGDRQSLQLGGRTRHYVVRLPTAEPIHGVKLPLVLVLHGGGGNAANAENMTGFTALGRARNLVVVYPEGTGPLGDKLLTWNAGHCCAYAMKNAVDDVEFFDALLDELIRRYPIDERRVYVTGMSNGAMMSHRLGIALAHRITAIAPVVGTLFGDERPPGLPVSAIIINGMRDESVPFQGGAPGGRGARSWDGTPASPAAAQFEFWSKANACAAPTREDNRLWTSAKASCAGHTDVAYYLIKDNGHSWPGGKPGRRRGDEPGSAMNATEVIWEFFAAHSR